MWRLMTSIFLLAAVLGGAAAARMMPEAAAAAFFTDPALAETRVLLVLKDGVPVIERFGRGYGPDNRFISWSMAKSVTSTLIGMLVADGKLQLDAPAPVPDWHIRADDPRGRITLAQLLHMSSGLQHIEAEPIHIADTNRALFGDQAHDPVGWAIAKPLEAPPGTKYSYSTLTTMILSGIVQRTIAPASATSADRRAAVRRFLVERLIEPAAMPSLVCEFDARGIMLGGSFCHASASDWARFGQMYLDNGVVAGVQVIPTAWVRWVQIPSATDGGYGGQFWLNHPRPGSKFPALFADQGPPDLYSAVGHLGQYVMVVPSKHLVVVRLGKTQDDVLQPVRTALGRLVNSFPDAAVPMPQGPPAP